MARFFNKPSTNVDDDLVEDQSSAASNDSDEEESWVLAWKKEMGEERGLGEEDNVVEELKTEDEIVVAQVSAFLLDFLQKMDAGLIPR